MIGPRNSFGFVAGRDEAQDGPSVRLHRRKVLPVDDGATKLSPPHDERHLVLVFHGGATWNRTCTIASKQGGVLPPFGSASTGRPSGSDHEQEDQCCNSVDRGQQPVRHIGADRLGGFFVLIQHEPLPLCGRMRGSHTDASPHLGEVRTGGAANELLRPEGMRGRRAWRRPRCRCEPLPACDEIVHDHVEAHCICAAPPL